MSLVKDVDALIQKLGSERAHLVGHDWGANVVWATAMYRPERVARLAVLNGPHPLRLLKGLLSPRQLLRSWYFFAYLVPGLPELLLRRDNYARLRAMLSRCAMRAGAFTTTAPTSSATRCKPFFAPREHKVRLQRGAPAMAQVQPVDSLNKV